MHLFKNRLHSSRHVDWRVQLGATLLHASLTSGWLILTPSLDHFANATVISAVAMCLGMVLEGPAAAFCALIGAALLLGLPHDAIHLALCSIAAIACGVMLRRGVRPEIALAIQFVTAICAHALDIPAAQDVMAVAAGAADQAGASVAAATALLMVLPQHSPLLGTRCRLRWDHVVFLLAFGPVAVIAVMTAAREPPAFTCAALLGALATQTALCFTVKKASAAPYEWRKARRDSREVLVPLAPRGIFPAESRRCYLDARRRLAQVQGLSARAMHKCQKLQAENNRLQPQLQEAQQALRVRTAQLQRVTVAHAHARGRYQALLTHSRDVTLFADANGTIRSASCSVQALLGFQPADLVGKSIKSLIPEDHILEHPLDLGYETNAAQIEAGIETAVRTASGKNQEVIIHVHAFRVGTTINYVIQLRAASEGRAARATLEQAKDLARNAHRSHDLFIAMMSHELRTPLHGLIATLDMMRTDENLPPQFEQRLTIARMSARALLRIANDVLDLTRIDTGHIPLEQKPFSLTSVIDEVLDESRARAESLGLTLERSIPQSLPPAFMGDPARLRQVLGNLVSNALHWTQSGGVTLSVAFAGTECTIDVTDTGCGIPPDKWQTIFDPFVQVESTQRRRAGGTGLGLPISRRLVEAMGGTLVLLRSDTKGSTFRVTLSLPTSSEPPPDEQSLRIFNNPRGRVLVVEDDAANRYVAEALLQSLDCPTTLVESGEEALKQLALQDFDLVLMDCQMPGMDGYETTRRVRREIARRVPIIAMTANAMADHRQVCLDAGMDDFLPKPFGRQALHAMLCKWLAPSTTAGITDDVAAKLASLPALDASVFEELRESLEWRLGPLHNIRTTFSTSARNILSLLDGTEGVDRHAVRRQLHTLLGSAGMVGARQVEWIARKLQGDLKAQSREVLDLDLTLLKQALRGFEIEFDRRLENSADECDWAGRLYGKSTLSR